MSDPRAMLALALAVLALTGCGEDAVELEQRADVLPVHEPDASTPREDQPRWLEASGDVDTEALLHWLHARGYAEWPSTGWPRPTAEGDSTVFMSARLEASVAQGDRVHPVGSIAVRELFGLDHTTPRAINVLVKVAPEPGVDTWRWFERDGPNSLSVDAIGATECVGCHTSPEDVVLTESPLR